MSEFYGSASENMDKKSEKVSVIILTLNEEENIGQCLKSIYGWSDDIYIVDSNSIDRTVEIAKKYTDNIYTIEKGHWENLRNWAISNIPLKYEWIIFVDADEWLTKELKNEITGKTNSDIEESGFYVPRRFIFLGKWLKHGRQYGKGELRLFKHKKTRYIRTPENLEAAAVDGKVGILKNNMIHQDLKPFSAWIDRHNRYSSLAAKRYIEIREGKIDEASMSRTLLQKIWYKFPLWVRPALMFFYVYVIKLGFLDGKEGLIYHLHHALWYELLIYTKAKEMKNRRAKELKDKR